MNAGSHTVSDEFAKQWSSLREEMSYSQRANPLAGLFLGYKLSGYEQQETRVLYVGKATDGQFAGGEAHGAAFGINTPFWHFARKVSKLADCEDNSLVNLAWSNVSKIGVQQGNPELGLQLAQKALSIATLRQEIADLKPTIGVFVCDGYMDDTIYEATYAKRGGMNDFETIPSDHGDFFSRGAIQVGNETLPPMIWLKHPQFQSNERQEEWLLEIKRLLASENR